MQVYTEVHFSHAHAVRDLRFPCRNLQHNRWRQEPSDPPSIEFSTMNLTIELRAGLIRTMNLTQIEGVWARLAHSDDFIPRTHTMHLTIKVPENLRVTTQPS